MNEITKYADFEVNIGKTVKIIGTIAKEIWQHFTILVDTYPYMNYFNLEDDYQIVIYTKEPISCERRAEIIGKLIKAEYERPNPRSKINDKSFEYQVLVNSWNCL
ncbi:MAG: hypothetical protein ACFFEY_07595 [Candidatus Thorarchaeota archaeon]